MISDYTNVDLSGYERVERGQKPATPPPSEIPLQPYRSAFLRCPIPPFSVSPDSLRALYQGSAVPINRAFNPASSVPGQGGTTVINETVTTASSSSSTSTSSSTPPTSQNATVTTPSLDPTQQFQGVVLLAKSFVVLQVSVNSAARVQLYATAAAQSGDSPRDNLTPVGLGSQQGIIHDWWLDTAPVAWDVTPRHVGTNGDNPQSNAVYITITNIGSASGAITATLVYVPLQS